MARTYDEKRDFSATPEPRFGAEAQGSGPLRFVVQRHHATRLHWDLRLECDGVLKSWAVPKGPSHDVKVKRAAIEVEDHPLEYGDFEGLIPKGQYGGGEVLIWDEGVYEPDDATGERDHDEALVRDGIAAGKLTVTFHGQRLRGRFGLVRTKRAEDQWLLFKKQDDFAVPGDVADEETSIRSGRTAEDLREGREAQPGFQPPPGARPLTLPQEFPPMAPSERDEPFDDPAWTFEVKLDGVRIVAVKDGARIKLISRNGKDVADRFPEVVASMADLPAHELALDGELVLLDENGRPSFSSLMKVYQRQKPSIGPKLWVFDVLFRDGFDLRPCAWTERRKVLESLPLEGGLRLHDTMSEDGELLYEQAIGHGFEGIVAKKKNSPYKDSARTTDWLKVRGYHAEEFVVGGYRKGKGGRSRSIGALLLGRVRPDGKLDFVGAVGTGFDEATLDGFRAELESRRADSPFAERPEGADQMVFVEPTMLVEVRYMGWTSDGKLRFPVFLRRRPDLERGPTMNGSELSQILAALDAPEDEFKIEVDGGELSLTSLDREVFPGIDKRSFLRYLALVSPALLAHLRDRPLAFVRYPDGVPGEGFFQRHWDHKLPPFVRTVEVFSDHANRVRELLICENLGTLLWLGQMSAIEFHPWHARVSTGPDAPSLGTDFRSEEALAHSTLEHPTYLVCDLDPNIRSGQEAEGAEPELNEAGWKRTVEVALALRQVLESLSLRGYVKTTGKTGIHVFVPAKRIYDSDQTREIARTLGAFLERQIPEDVTLETRLAKRPAKVFFDANMNGGAKTLAAAYSPRPTPDARVSMPLDWEVLDKVRPEDFTIRTVPDILAAKGDAWAKIDSDWQLLVR